MTEQQAINKERSHVAEAIYANEAISQGVKEGKRQSSYIDCGECGYDRPAVKMVTNEDTGVEAPEFCQCVLKTKQTSDEKTVKKRVPEITPQIYQK